MKSNSKSFMKMSIIFMLMLVLTGIFSMPVFAKDFGGATIAVDTEYTSEDLQIKYNAKFTVKEGATLTLDNVILRGAQAGDQGEIIKIEKGGKLIIKNSKEWNASKVVINSDGGEIEIINSLFENNKNSVIHAINSKISIKQSYFRNNTANAGGAIYIVNNSTLTIDEGVTCPSETVTPGACPTKFEGNKATNQNQSTLLGGGAIYAKQSVVNVINGKFINNEANFYGGAIHQEGGTLVFGQEDDDTKKPTFSLNKATGQTVSRGGAVALEINCLDTSDCKNNFEPLSATIYNAVFDENTSKWQGGAMAIGCNPNTGGKLDKDNKGVIVEIKKGEFTGNTVTNNWNDGMAGGAIMIFSHGTLSMRKVAMTNNTASSAGGAIATCGTGNTYLFINDGSVIYGNHSQYSGASGYEDLYVFDHSVELDINDEMFNGGTHNWKKLDNQLREGKNVAAYYGSAPEEEYKKTDGYYVLFSENRASGTNAPVNGNGGAIGNNGTLIIGGTTKVSITKKWKDNNWEKRPSMQSFVESLDLKENGKAYKLEDIQESTPCAAATKCFTATEGGLSDPINITITENDQKDSWSVEITGLPSMLHDDDKDVDVVVTWTLDEHMANYLSEVEKTADNDKKAFDVTNELNVKTISGKKEWDHTAEGGSVNPEDSRPTSIEIHLHKKGEDAEQDQPYKTTTATAANNWEWKFEDVPVKENGVDIEYTVHEVPVKDYTLTNEDTAKQSNGTYIFNNKFAPGLTDIVVYKDWKDDSNWDGSRPEFVQVILYRLAGEDKIRQASAFLNQKNDWKHTFTALEASYQYTIEEVPVTGYKSSTISKMNGHGFEIVNTHEPAKVKKLTVTKVWDDALYGVYRPNYTAKAFAESLTLMANGKAYELNDITEVTGSDNTFTFTANAAAGAVTIVVNMPERENSWTVTYSNLPANEKGQNGNPITWSVEEAPIAHYSMEETRPFQCSENVTDGKTCTVEITNSLHFTQLKLTKQWKDDSDAESRPDPLLFLEGLALYHDGIYLPHGTFYKDPNKTPTSDTSYYKVTSNSNLEVTVTMDGNKWSITIDKLMQWFENKDGVMEKVKVWTAEEFVEGYHSEAETLEDGTISITNEPFVINVEKVWESSNREQHELPESITVRLIADGEETDQTIELTPDDDGNWIGSFTGMRKYEDDGRHEIVYTVREENIPEGYISSVSGDKETGFRITNSLPPERTWFRLPELPKTGFSAVRPTVLSAQPLNVSYVDSGLTLQVPSLDVKADIVTVPFVDGEYPVEWLGMQAGMLEGSAKPGEGMMVLTGHNTLNSTEAGPFAFLSFMEEGDMIFLLNKYNQLKPYTVYAVEKIGATDSAALERIASMDENSLTMLTCEDELPEGGYASRRVVAAKPEGTW